MATRRKFMKKRIIKKINTSKRNFLTGSVALAGVAAATSVLPISIAKANHEDSDPKGLPDLLNGKIGMLSSFILKKVLRHIEVQLGKV